MNQMEQLRMELNKFKTIHGHRKDDNINSEKPYSKRVEQHYDNVKEKYMDEVDQFAETGRVYDPKTRVHPDDGYIRKNEVMNCYMEYLNCKQLGVL